MGSVGRLASIQGYQNKEHKARLHTHKGTGSYRGWTLGTGGREGSIPAARSENYQSRQAKVPTNTTQRCYFLLLSVLLFVRSTHTTHRYHSVYIFLAYECLTCSNLVPLLVLGFSSDRPPTAVLMVLSRVPSTGPPSACMRTNRGYAVVS